MSFHGSIGHLVFVLNDIPLSGCPRVYLSTHWLKDFLVASKFWQSWIQLRWPFTCRFCVDRSFQLLWVNAKEHNCWILCWDYVWFCEKRPNCLPKWLYHFALYQRWTGVPVAPRPHQHLVLSVFWILDFLRDVQWYPIVLICVSQQHTLVNIFSHGYLQSYIFRGCLFKSFAHFKIGLFIFLLLSLKSSLHILDNSLLSDMSLTNILSFCGLGSHSLDMW